MSSVGHMSVEVPPFESQKANRHSNPMSPPEIGPMEPCAVAQSPANDAVLNRSKPMLAVGHVREEKERIISNMAGGGRH